MRFWLSVDHVTNALSLSILHFHAIEQEAFTRVMMDGHIQIILLDSLWFDLVHFIDVFSLYHQIAGHLPTFHFFVFLLLGP